MMECYTGELVRLIGKGLSRKETREGREIQKKFFNLIYTLKSIKYVILYYNN
jgi:hypothetical protein